MTKSITPQNSPVAGDEAQRVSSDPVAPSTGGSPSELWPVPVPAAVFLTWEGETIKTEAW